MDHSGALCARCPAVGLVARDGGRDNATRSDPEPCPNLPASRLRSPHRLPTLRWPMSSANFQARWTTSSATADDVRRPRHLHPAFYGSFDWHSCVHMHWLLARVRRLVPGLPQRAAIDALFDAHVTPANIAAECAYLARPESRGFERTYGWAWLLELATELRRSADAGSQRWSATLQPLTDAFVASVHRLPAASSTIRCAQASIPTARSACCLRLTTREARANPRSKHSASNVRAHGMPGTAMRRPRGNRRAPISFRLC